MRTELRSRTVTRQSDNDFGKVVDRLVLGYINLGVASFAGLLLALPGVYPTAALQSVKNLAARGHIPRRVLDLLLAEVKDEPAAYRSVAPMHLPVPHPLDYEWRFSSSAIARLHAETARLTVAGDTVVAAGIPSLAYNLDATPLTGRSLIVIDNNKAALDDIAKRRRNSAQVSHADLMASNGQFARCAALVLFDGPWYPEYFNRFLDAASRIVVQGGHVIASMPPVGTRPDIANERAAFLAHAEKQGLIQLETLALALSYVSPPFERNALTACGIRNYPSEWRRGDLLLLKKRGSESHAPAPIVSDAPRWQEACVMDVRIRVRAGRETTLDPAAASLERIVESDILPSVSRRDERRELADVWTSGNRVFRCQQPRVIYAILEAMERGKSVIANVEALCRRRLSEAEVDSVSAAAAKFLELVTMEHNELTKYAYF